MGKQTYLNKSNNDCGFTLLEVLISILILSVIITFATSAFVYAAGVSRENRLSLGAMNLANKAVEDIRAMKFADIGTKVIANGVIIYGDPAGDIPQTRTWEVDGVEYTIETTISWEEQGGWDLGDTDWDYKSVRVSVVPTGDYGNPKLTKVIETYVTRDSTQPALTGSNISLRVIRGWNTLPGVKNPVVNASVRLTSGPSAPRQVRTSSAGVARFINLAPGSYTVSINPENLGMILHPDQTADWSMNLIGAVTNTKEFEAEYPCSIRISLLDLDGNPIQMDQGETGEIKILVPYGTEIIKEFAPEDISISGALPENYITGLWPVGAGYTGAYTIADVSIAECQYLGGYEMTPSGEAGWSGTFDEPGTVKDITCYFVTIPKTPSEINTGWVEAGGQLVSGWGPYTAYNEGETDIIASKFASGNPGRSLIMPDNTTTAFNASRIFFENTGSRYHPGLLIEGRSNLNLHGCQIIFRGVVEIEDSGMFSEDGKITLHTWYTDGTQAAFIDGNLIGGIAGVPYGKVYFAGPLIADGVEILEPGGYYYHESLVLPDHISQLIPITRGNYIP